MNHIGVDQKDCHHEARTRSVCELRKTEDVDAQTYVLLCWIPSVGVHKIRDSTSLVHTYFRSNQHHQANGDRREGLHSDSKMLLPAVVSFHRVSKSTNDFQILEESASCSIKGHSRRERRYGFESGAAPIVITTFVKRYRPAGICCKCRQ